MCPNSRHLFFGQGAIVTFLHCFAHGVDGVEVVTFLHAATIHVLFAAVFQHAFKIIVGLIFIVDCKGPNVHYFWCVGDELLGLVDVGFIPKGKQLQSRGIILENIPVKVRANFCGTMLLHSLFPNLFHRIVHLWRQLRRLYEASRLPLLFCDQLDFLLNFIVNFRF